MSLVGRSSACPVGGSSAGFRRRLFTIVAAIAVTLLSAAAALAATSAAPPPQVLNYQVYVGGKGKAKANLSPVVLGWINTQGGPPNATFPQVTDVARAAVRMINAEKRACAAASRWSTTRT
jgi:hypothetical protein